MAHRCHAKNCAREVPPRLLMCLRHWRRVPKPLQAAVWAAYRPGQEVDKRPSREYLLASTRAIKAVAEKEGLPTEDEDRVIAGLEAGMREDATA